MKKVFKLFLKGQKFSKKNLKFLFFYKINKQKITKKKAVNFLFGEKKNMFRSSNKNIENT